MISSREVLFRVCWLGTLLAAGIAVTLFLMLGLVPLEAAEAVSPLVMAICVIPYVFTRALAGLIGAPSVVRVIENLKQTHGSMQQRRSVSSTM